MTSENSEQKRCIEDGCDEPRERVITLYGGVAPCCVKHARERLEHPDAIDDTPFFRGERDEPFETRAEMERELGPMP